MTRAIQFDPVQLPPEAEAMRERVRDFLEQEASAGTFAPNGLGMTGHSPAFSQRCGAAGFIGMTWPRKYGGGERSFLERFVVSEEMIAAGAPVW
ncbi:MAG TPA: acyl-CoA dehydrogenase family protein, partial [Gammaproteobacteria bacterium]|nr:acyl-CoA dehydrogenase family protein [Gammaproteobacteria bacterium]